MNRLLDEQKRQKSIEEDTEHTPVSKYRLNVEHMPSAQINQMTS